MGQSREFVQPLYVPLHNHSYYSLIGRNRSLAIPSPHDLIETAYKKGHSALGITDTNFLGLRRFLRAAHDVGIKPIPGLEVPVYFNVTRRYTPVTIYPRDNQGLEHLFSIASKYHQGRQAALEFSDLGINTGNIIVFLYEPHEELLEDDNVFLALNSPGDSAIHTYRERKDKREKIVVAHESRMTSAGQLGVLKLLFRLFKEQYPSMDPDRLLNHDLKAPLEIVTLYQHLPAAIARSQEIAQSINIELPTFPKIRAKIVPDGIESFDFLASLVWHAWSKYPDNHAVRGRVKTELDLIKQLNFSDYFLINLEIVQYCNENAIPFTISGSGNNSLALNLLGMTEVDARQLNLSRFMSLERSTPDIDIQVPYNRKWEVTNYLLHRYPQSAQLFAIIQHLHERGIEQLNKRTKANLTPAEIRELANFELPYQVSVHPSGVILAGNLPQIRVGKHSFAQMDKVDAEDNYHLFKIDILAKYGEAYLEEALKLLKQDGIAVDFPEFDQDTLDYLFKRLITIGITNLESPHLRRVLTIFGELVKKPTVTHLAHALALARLPASTRGEYFSYWGYGRNTLSSFAQVYPELGEILAKTNFVAIFQEQVMAIGTRLAKLSTGESERLRKMMSEDIPVSENENLLDKIKNSLSPSYSPKVVKELVRQVTNFASYGFVEGHSYALARFSLKLAYLAEKYPAHFWTAVLKIVIDKESEHNYPMQAYINAALGAGITFIFPHPDKLTNAPKVFEKGRNKKVLVGRKFFRDDVDFDYVYHKLSQLLRSDNVSLRNLIKFQLDYFGRVYTHNPLHLINTQYLARPNLLDVQEIVGLFLHHRPDENLHFITVESSDFVDIVVNPSELQSFYTHLKEGFCHLRIRRSPGIFPPSWEIVEILPVSDNLFVN